MADRRLELEVVATNRTDATIREVERDVDRLRRKSDESSKRSPVRGWGRDFDETAKHAIKFGERLSSSIASFGGGILSSLPTEAKAVFAGVAASAAITLAPAIGAAVVAGIGGAGIAAGIAVAARDPQVKAAFGSLADDIMAELDRATRPFQGELIKSAGIFKTALRDAGPDLEAMFADLSKAIQPLATSLGLASGELLGSFRKAAAASIPILEMIGDEMVDIADATGDWTETFADWGNTSRVSLEALLNVVEYTIRVFDFLTAATFGVIYPFVKLGEVLGLVDTSTKKLSPVLHGNASAAQAAGNAYGSLANQMSPVVTEAENMTRAFKDLFGEQLSVDQANLAVRKGFTELRSELAANTKTLDLNKAAGQENVGVILSQIEAINRKREADIAAGNGTAGAVATANAAYLAQIQQLKALLLQLGFTRQEVEKLLGAYERIPTDISTTVTTIYRTKGTPPGYSDQLTGHSRTGGADYGAGTVWLPDVWARAAATFAGAAFRAAEPAGLQRTDAPRDVSVKTEVLLDGRPFRAYTSRAVDESARREAFRRRHARVEG